MIPFITIPLPTIFGFHLEPFGILVFTGCMVGIHYAKKRAISQNINPLVIDDIALYCCILFGFFGAHLVHFLVYDPKNFFHDPLIFFKQFRSGLSSFGGFIFAALGILIYVKRHKLPFLPYAEAITFGLLPGWIFGRLGCTTAHDHMGKPTNFFLGVKYPGGTRHDLGFYEVLLAIFMTAVVYGLASQKKQRPTGFYFSISLIMYSLGRFFLDFLRIEDAQYFGLTAAQYICIFTFIYGIYLVLRLVKQSSEV